MNFRITISRAIFAFGALVAVGLISVIFASNFALSQLKVGGPLYDKIKLGNDLVADILPPPEYVIEAYLEVDAGAAGPIERRRARATGWRSSKRIMTSVTTSGSSPTSIPSSRRSWSRNRMAKSSASGR